MKIPKYYVAIALLASPSSATAEEDVFSLFEQDAQSAKSFQLDLNTPTSPGFSVIGASPNRVTNPGSLQELVFDNAGFVENGSLKPGIAINFQPFWLFGGDVTLEEYSGQFLSGEANPEGFSRLQRILARTQLSIASVQGENASLTTGVRYGFGFHTQLLDGSDPRDIAAAKCTIKAWNTHAQHITDQIALNIITQVNAARAKNPNVDTKAVKEKLVSQEFDRLATPGYDKAYEDCTTEAEWRFLRARSWMIGSGIAISSSSGNLDNFAYSGSAFWTTVKQPFGSNKSFVLFGQADFDRRFAAGSGAMVSGNSYNLAASLALEELTWKLDATASYHFSDAHFTSFTDDYLQFALNGAFKLRDGIWLEGSLGTRTGSSVENDSFGLVQLKLDLSKAAQNFLK